MPGGLSPHQRRIVRALWHQAPHFSLAAVARHLRLEPTALLDAMLVDAADLDRTPAGRIPPSEGNPSQRRALLRRTIRVLLHAGAPVPRSLLAVATGITVSDVDAVIAALSNRIPLQLAAETLRISLPSVRTIATAIGWERSWSDRSLVRRNRVRPSDRLRARCAVKRRLRADQPIEPTLLAQAVRISPLAVLTVLDLYRERPRTIEEIRAAVPMSRPDAKLLALAAPACLGRSTAGT